MTPHTPVEGLVAKWRETTPDDFNGCGDKTEACWERLACANELEQALASLPVEGWRDATERVVRDELAAHCPGGKWLTGPNTLAMGIASSLIERLTLPSERYVRAGFAPVSVVDGERLACLWHAHNQRTGVMTSVMDRARKEKWAGGKFDDRMRDLGWTLEPIYMIAATPQDQRQGNEQGGTHE